MFVFSARQHAVSRYNAIASPSVRLSVRPSHEWINGNGKWLPDFIERLKASAWHQLYLPLLPFTHARSESINATSKTVEVKNMQYSQAHQPVPLVFAILRDKFHLEIMTGSPKAGYG